LAAIAGERVARQAILFDRAFDARQAEAAGLCDVVVPRGQMDTALARAVSETTEGGAVAVAAQRKALRVGAESIDTFRRYMALYVREQALCMYSDGLIANLQTYWNAQNRVL
jgi:thioesterase DpgC